MFANIATVATRAHSLADDFCGTPVPGHHFPPTPPSPLQALLASPGKLDAVALNPQPLPPAGVASKLGALLDDWCGTGRPKLPPPPPPPLPGLGR